jgi:hypothetical protein
MEINFSKLMVSFQTTFVQAMKNSINAISVSLILFLASCSGSDVYQGNWKAKDAEGNKFEIVFEPKSFEIKDVNGKVLKYEYAQNSVKIENTVKTYGIHLSDGRIYNIFFPMANDTTKAIIRLPNDEIIYTMSRTSYIGYKDLYKLTK